MERDLTSISSSSGGRSKKVSIYHEKNRLQFCLLHALNNLFQVSNLLLLLLPSISSQIPNRFLMESSC